jgi:hypothetical protein
MADPNIDWKHLDFQAFLQLIATEEMAFEYCFRNGLIDRTRRCECGRAMLVAAKAQATHACHFICSAPRSICSQRRSILTDSFFSKARISISAAMKCIAGYAAELSNNQFFFFTGLKSSHSVTNWKNYFRIACASFIDQLEERRIGGVGCTVEVDETLVFKRKNHVGRLLSNEASGTWVFGGICRETDDAFIIPIECRDAPTLLAAIQANVLPGTRIVSDCWRAYQSVPLFGYEHAAINHSLNFVDPMDPTVNTQKIERMWKTLKNTIPKECNSELRWGYLDEFIFKQRNRWYSLNVGERIALILNKIKNTRFN